MAKKEPEITLFVQSWPTTLGHTAVTLLLFVALFAPGIWFESEAMQWAAGIMWFLAIIGMASSYAKGNRVTISGARKRLDEIERESASAGGQYKGED